MMILYFYLTIFILFCVITGIITTIFEKKTLSKNMIVKVDDDSLCRKDKNQVDNRLYYDSSKLTIIDQDLI